MLGRCITEQNVLQSFVGELPYINGLSELQEIDEYLEEAVRACNDERQQDLFNVYLSEQDPRYELPSNQLGLDFILFLSLGTAFCAFYN